MNERILVVDDDQTIRSLIADILQDCGFVVDLAVDGLDALEKMQDENYDLFIIDVFMPRMDGLELLTKIKDFNPLAVVVVSTGFSSVENAIQAIRNGAYHYLTKPIQADALIQVVKAGMDHALMLTNIPGSSREAGDPSLESKAPALLQGFNLEQCNEFRDCGSLAYYKEGDTVPLIENPGAMVWVESGYLTVYVNKIAIETLEAGDIWGEEVFVNINTSSCTLIVQKDCQLRHFNRKRLIEFFTYQEETLVKRYMINLIQNAYSRWWRAVMGIVLNHGFFALDQQD